MKRQNIILFLCDQWRWDTLNDPSNPALLPNLQAFKQEATNYVNAFTPVPLCTPARGSLFTGKWPHQTGTMDNVQGTSFFPHGKLHKSQVTYLERLQDAGYKVVFNGKWHLGKGTLVERGILDVDYCDGGDGQLGSDKQDTLFSSEKLTPYYGTITEGTHMDGDRVVAALEKLKDLATQDGPFCYIISLHGPHFPHHVPMEFVALYNDLPTDFMPENFCPQFSETGKPVAQSAPYWPCQDTRSLTQADWRKTAQHYWGFCSFLDKLFGDVRRSLDENDFEDNTVLAFATDHGEMLGAHGWFDKGPFFYDEVMRIPLMVRDPSALKPEPAEQFVNLRDLLPTLISIAGAEDVLTQGEKERVFANTSDDCAFYCYDAYQGRQFKFRGIHEARFKYAWSPHDIEELYDLETDPHERVNLAADPSHRDVKARLRHRLIEWMTAENDALALGGSHLPVGSYIDGRDRTEQHDHHWPTL